VRIGVDLRILVTGAVGFIGSSVASNLAQLGHSVLGVDNFSRYYSIELKNARKAALLDAYGVNLQNIDLSKPEALRSLFSKESFDVVLHLGAQAGVRVSVSNWDWYKRDNLDAFSNVLLSSVQHEVPNFIYASSSSVYGNGHNGAPLHELKTKAHPISFYGATKLSNEILAEACSKQTGIRTRGLRFFTVYGPWGRPDMVYFRMVTGALVDEPFQFFGDGAVIRDFTFIDDVTSSVSDLMLELTNRDKGTSDIVNVGGGMPISINECLEIIEGILGFKVPFIRVKTDDRDVDSTNADFTYLESLIGNFPKTTAKEGLERFINWATLPDIRSNLSSWVKSVN
jgi:UDP-glucuronate 4-epimerase